MQSPSRRRARRGGRLVAGAVGLLTLAGSISFISPASARAELPAVPTAEPLDPAALVAEIGGPSGDLARMAAEALGAEADSTSSSNPLNQAQYTIVMTHPSFGTKRQPSVVGVPTPVDFWAGNPGPEAVVTLLGNPGVAALPPSATLRIDKLPALPTSGDFLGLLTIAAEYTVAPGQVAAVGYGVERFSHAPATFQLTATTQNGTIVANAVMPADPNKFLLVGEYRSGTTIRMLPSFQPRPANIALTLTPRTGDSLVRVGVDVPTTLGLSGHVQEGTRKIDVAAGAATLVPGAIDGSPGSLQLQLQRSGTADTSAIKTAAPLSSASVNLQQTDGGTLVSHVKADLANVPTAVSLVRHGGSRAVLINNGPIGRARLAVGLGRPTDHPASAPADRGYVNFTAHTNGTAELQAQVLDLRTADLSWGDTIRVDELRHRGGGFDLRTTPPGGVGTSVVATLTGVPAFIDEFSYQKTPTRVVFRGDSALGRAVLDVASNAGVLFGRVNRAIVDVSNVPSNTVLQVATSGSNVALNTSGAGIGLASVELTSGPRLPLGSDGVRLHDLPSYFYLHGRLTGLRGFDLGKSTTCGASVQIPFTTWYYQECTDHMNVGVRTQGDLSPIIDIRTPRANRPGVNDVLTGQLTRMPANVTLNTQLERATLRSGSPTGPLVAQTGTSTRASYMGRTISGGAPNTSGSSLVLHTESGQLAEYMDMTMQPLPADFSFCSQPFKGGCVNSGKTADEGSVALLASQQVEVDLFSCKRDTFPCLQNADSEWLRIDDLRVQRIRFERHEGSSTSDPHRVHLDTDNYNLSGRIRTNELDVVLPHGFRTDNREVRYYLSLWGITYSTSGSVYCPANTSINTRVLGVWINVAGFFC